MSAARHRGFSLIEVLIALAILGIALAALIKAGSSNAGNAAALRDRTFGQWVAMNELARMQAAGEWPSVGDLSGSSPMAGHEYFWTMTVKDTQAESMRRVEIEVRDNEDAEDTIARFTGFLGEPRE